MRTRTLISGEFRSVFRDPVTTMVLFLPLLFIFLLKFAYPLVVPCFSTSAEADRWYDFALFFFYQISPAMAGFVIGFNLLEEKDEGIFSYIAVTPFSLKRWFLFKNLLGTVLALIFNSLLMIFADRSHNLSSLAVVLFASLLVPFFSMTMTLFAGNKVEGMTVGKVLTFVFAGGIPVFLTDSHLMYLGGFLPPFWLARIYTSAGLIPVFLNSLFFLVNCFFLFLLLRKRLKKL